MKEKMIDFVSSMLAHLLVAIFELCLASGATYFIWNYILVETLEVQRLGIGSILSILVLMRIIFIYITVCQGDFQDEPK